MVDMALTAVDLSEHQFAPPCEQGCGRPATVIAQGCMDKQPVLMCDECLTRGIEVVKLAIHYYQALTKKVMIWFGEAFPPPTREDRIRAWYHSIAGPYPGPCAAAVATILAHRIVELEDKREGRA
jgi:hypothetical protein